MTYLEYAKEQLRELAQAGHFSNDLNDAITNGKYELRPADLIIKKFINGLSSETNLLEGESQTVAGVNDFDKGNTLNSKRGFFAPRIRIDFGNAGNGVVDPGLATYGGINVPEANEAKLKIVTNENLIYDRSVSAVTQGVSTDDRKATQAFAVLDKPIILVDNSIQKVSLKFPVGTSVPAAVNAADASQRNRAIAIRLDGFEIIGK